MTVANRSKEEQASLGSRALLLPGLPHHVTQRGDHREPVFFATAALRGGTAVWRVESKLSP